MARPFPNAVVMPQVIPYSSKTRTFLDNSLVIGCWLRSKLNFLIEKQRWILNDLSEMGICKDSILTIPKEANLETILSKTKEIEPSLLIIPLPRNFDELNKYRDQLYSKFLQEFKNPIFLVSLERCLRYPPFDFLLVPMDAHSRYSHSLEAAIEISRLHQTPLEILHVSEKCRGDEVLPRLHGVLRDQAHHEYPRAIDTFVAESIPFSSHEDRSRIRTFKHHCGPTQEILIDEINRSGSAAIICEWNGSFALGRADLLKAVLNLTNTPLLLVRRQERKKAQLRVATRFDDALH